MIRRIFLTDDTPYYLERFSNERIMIFETNDDKTIEYSCGHYNLVSSDDKCFIINKLSKKQLESYNKAYETTVIRYFVPLNNKLDAKMDLRDESLTINVDFNTKEEADSFEIPSWFGKELFPNVKTKKLK